MGKSLVIKGADFSANAIGSQGVIWRTSLTDAECFSGDNNRKFGGTGGTYTQVIPSIAGRRVVKVWVKSVPYQNTNGGYKPNIHLVNGSGTQSASISISDGITNAHIHEITLQTPLQIESDGIIGVVTENTTAKQRNYFCILLNPSSSTHYVSVNDTPIDVAADTFYKIETE